MIKKVRKDEIRVKEVHPKIAAPFEYIFHLALIFFRYLHHEVPIFSMHALYSSGTAPSPFISVIQDHNHSGTCGEKKGREGCEV